MQDAENEKKTLRDKIVKELLCMGLDSEQLQQVKKPVVEDNRQSIASWSIIASLFWCMSLLMSLSSPAYRACRLVYVGALVVDLISFVSARFLTERYPLLMRPTMHLFELSLLMAGIGIAICQPDVRTATMIAFAVLIPTVVIDDTISDIAIQGIAIVAYATLARGIIEPDIYSWGLTNLVIFSAAGIATGHTINKARSQRYVYAESARQLAEIQRRYAYYDQLTGLQNRRAYVEELGCLVADAPAEYCIVMADLNGLKEANDNCGHDAGDELIVGAAECLTAAFEGISTIYRIGGDEFCIVVEGTAGDATRRVERLNELVASWRGSRGNGMSLSCGVASSREQQGVDAVVAQADQNMYANKRDYYMKSGRDRRRRAR